MEIAPRITIEPGKCDGKPCIRGYRLTVEHLLAVMADGATFAELKADWPFLEPEDLTAALLFASALAGERTVTVGS